MRIKLVTRDVTVITVIGCYCNNNGEKPPWEIAPPVDEETLTHAAHTPQSNGRIAFKIVPQNAEQAKQLDTDYDKIIDAAHHRWSILLCFLADTGNLTFAEGALHFIDDSVVTIAVCDI